MSGRARARARATRRNGPQTAPPAKFAAGASTLDMSGSSGALIRVKLIRHLFGNGDCGTNEVHAKPIIRLKFPPSRRVAAAPSQNTLDECRRNYRAPRTIVSVSIHRPPRLPKGLDRELGNTAPRIIPPRGPTDRPTDRRISGWASLNKAIEVKRERGANYRKTAAARFANLTRYTAPAR